MKTIVRVLAVSVLGLYLVPFVQAQVIGTITCQAPGASTLTGPIFASLLDVDVQDWIDLYDVTVYADISLLGPLLAAEAAKTSYTTCTLGNGTNTSISNAVLTDVEASVSGAGVQSALSQVYASATFFFSSVTVGGVTVSSKAQTTAEARASAVAMVRAKNLANVIPKGIALQ